MLSVSRFARLCKNTSYVKFYFRPPSHVCTSQFNFLISQRNFYRKAYRYVFPTNNDMKLQDKVSPDYKLIYVGYSLRYVIYGYRCLVSITAAGALSLLANILMGKSKILTYLWYPEYYPHYFLVTSYIVLILAGAHHVAKHYVYRIYYNESKNKYLAVLMGKHAFDSRMIELEPNSVVQIRPSTRHIISPMKDHMYKTSNNEVLHLNHSKFEAMFYYNNLVKDSIYR